MYRNTTCSLITARTVFTDMRARELLFSMPKALFIDLWNDYDILHVVVDNITSLIPFTAGISFSSSYACRWEETREWTVYNNNIYYIIYIQNANFF